MEKMTKSDKCPPAGSFILQRINELGITRTELAIRADEHMQTISAILNGRREIPIPLSVRLDSILGLTPGTTAQVQTTFLVTQELDRHKGKTVPQRKQHILQKIKDNGGFWSYAGTPEHADDDDIIEAALIHLDLEDLPLLMQIWSKAHVKKVWKERLVSQGRRMNVLNYMLAVKLFSIRHPDHYIARYAKF